MTLLVTSIRPTNLAELVERAASAWEGGSDAVEVRIDTFGDDPSSLAAYLRRHRHRTWIVTCRSADEGGLFEGDMDARLTRLLTSVRGTNVWVDFECADFSKMNDSQRAPLLAFTEAGGRSTRLILSSHHFADAPQTVAISTQEQHRIALMENLDQLPRGTVRKVAYQAAHIYDGFTALDWMHRHGSTITAVAMGEEGLWTRVLAKKLGAFATYCALDTDSATAPGQQTLHDMMYRYRWEKIDKSTRVFGVMGDPVSHSMGPLLFNQWFEEQRINAVYLPLRVGSDHDGVRRFLEGCCDRPWLGLEGLSVTIPHKASVRHWVGDGADAMAGKIGAVNTLCLRPGGIRAFNTDCYAALASLTDALGCARNELAGLPVDVLGTGGAARAILFGLRECGCNVTVFGRSPEKTSRLAGEFGAQPDTWHNRENRRGEVLINCTSVGLWPDVDETPMPSESLTGCRLVFDLIYNPLETRLLRDAVAVGSKGLNGLDMFLRQAAMQFELWTGCTADREKGSTIIEREIRKMYDL